ncbi:MAG: transposase, partial [Planctomycetota bacterium]|nr:transposase [Planctomycetota bacterium]
MARLARVVIPGIPHHITQRGNRRQQVFFRDDDYDAYLELMAEWCRKSDVEIWAYCLMPNHVHLIALPQSEDSLAQGIGEAHKRYTRRINFREKWRGYLWQGRFASFPMDEQYLYVAARYIELNPVRAGLVQKPEEYEWSIANAHLKAKDDKLVTVKPLLEIAEDWKTFLENKPSEDEINLLRKHETTGRPLGSEGFIKKLEQLFNRIFRPRAVGR